MKIKSLLIIDDETLLVENLKFLLGGFADTIYTANNGKEGLKVLEAQAIHCVICDITMPVMNGIELIKEVRRRNISVPFIFYSAYGNREMMLEVAKYGAFEFLKKPDFQGLEDVISRGSEGGFHRHVATASTSEVLSEYQRILDEIDI